MYKCKSYKLTQIIVEINMAVATIGKLKNKTKKTQPKFNVCIYNKAQV